MVEATLIQVVRGNKNDSSHGGQGVFADSMSPRRTEAMADRYVSSSHAYTTTCSSRHAASQ